MRGAAGNVTFTPWRAHGLVHFVRGLPNGGPQPGKQLTRPDTHAGEGRNPGFQHPGSQAPPARVNGAHCCAAGVAKQHRQAIGRQHGADDSSVGSHGTVAAGAAPCDRESQHLVAVHLCQPGGLGRQPRAGG